MKRILIIILATGGICFGQGSYVGPFIDSMWRDIIAEPNAHFQPAADSTTFFQILDADGGTPIFNVDSTNERVGIGTASPGTKLEVNGTIVASKLGLGGITDLTAGGNVGANSVATFAIPASTETVWGMVTTGTNAKRFALNANSDASWTLFDGVSKWNAGITQKSGNVGIGTTSPDTLLHLEGTAPYLTIHNNTHEDTDGGRESIFDFKGQQSGGEETTLARIEVSHDGAADDQKGKIGIYTNDGSDDDTPTLRMTINSAGAIDVVGDFTAGTIQADNGFTGTGAYTNFTIVGGIITAAS